MILENFGIMNRFKMMGKINDSISFIEVFLFFRYTISSLLIKTLIHCISTTNWVTQYNHHVLSNCHRIIWIRFRIVFDKDIL